MRAKDIPLTPFANAQAFAQRGNCGASGLVGVLPSPEFAGKLQILSPPCQEGRRVIFVLVISFYETKVSGAYRCGDKCGEWVEDVQG